MSTATWSSTSDNSHASSFYRWAHALSANTFGAFGWSRASDTGQIVWPVSLFNITDANGNGTTVTFTGTITDGGATLRVGQQIKVSGTTDFGTVAAPIVYTVTGGNLTTTWTAASATNAHDASIAANTGWGTVYTLVTITSVTGNGATATYTYTNTDGTLLAGQSIVIPQTGTTGFTNAGFNGTFTVLTANGTTFTVTNGTNATETKTVTAQVATLPGCILASASTNTTFPPAATNFLYEVWEMTDTLQSTTPVLVKNQYSAATTTSAAQFAITLGRTTDGAGNFTGATSGLLVMTDNTTSGTSDTVATNSYASGSTNRINICYRPERAATIPYQTGYLSIERSHDSTGADTSAYVTISTIECRTGNAAVTNQVSLGSSGATVAETKIPTVTKTGTLTGSYGSSTILCPAFPVVGAIGNPMTNTLIGKAADWVDLTNFSFTMYNTSRNYQVVNLTAFTATAGNLTYDSTVTSVLIFRFD